MILLQNEKPKIWTDWLSKQNGKRKEKKSNFQPEDKNSDFLQTRVTISFSMLKFACTEKTQRIFRKIEGSENIFINIDSLIKVGYQQATIDATDIVRLQEVQK